MQVYSASRRARGWHFTDFTMEKEFWTKLCREDPTIVYVVIGRELCPDTDREHGQGFMWFKHARSWSSMRKLLGRRHVEPMYERSSVEASRRYCSKDNDLWFQHGEPPRQGKRSDLDDVKEILASGRGMAAVVESANSYQAMRAAELILKYKEPCVRTAPTVYWFWGATGTGKTQTAYSMATSAGLEPWISGKNLRWWDGYDSHKFVIFDDFRKDFCTFHELLRILDRYPYRVECKGGSRQLLAETIVITSPLPPIQVYETREDLGQLMRRISEVREFAAGATAEEPTASGSAGASSWQMGDGGSEAQFDWPTYSGRFGDDDWQFGSE